MPAGTYRKSVKNRPSRRKNSMANRPQPTVPIGIVSATKSGSVLTIVFNQPVVLKGLPQYAVNVVGVTAQSAAMTSATTLALTFTGAITTATLLIIPYEEPAVRNASGGFVGSTNVAVV